MDTVGPGMLSTAGAVFGQSLSIFDPASPSALSIVNLAILALAVTGLIFLVVEGVLLYSVWRFRHPAGAESTGEPPQVYGSMPIEVAWTAAPTMIVFFLVLVTTRTLWEVERDLPQPAAGDNTLVRHRDRPPMVVGVRLRHLRRPEARLRHGQRTAHPGERREHVAPGVSRR